MAIEITTSLTKEIPIGNILGCGSYFIVFSHRYNNDQVIKVPITRPHLSSKGRTLFARTAHDIDLTEKYFPQNFVPTKIIENKGLWYITQKRISSYESLSSNNANPEFIKQANDIFAQAQKMLEETGFGLDFTGSEGLKEILNFLKKPHFKKWWCLPSLLVDKAHNSLMIADCNLFFSNRYPSNSVNTAHLNFEPLQCRLTYAIAQRMIGRMNKAFN